MGAEEVAADDTRMFCKCWFMYWSKIAPNHRRSYIGWGARAEDRCWYKEEVNKYLDEKEKEKGSGEKPKSKSGRDDQKTPNRRGQKKR